jgi:protoporphyrinogen oxidase
MNGLLGQRAVVVGAGIGGLSMAGALANHFEQVEVLERDGLTTPACSRPGTPQDRHPHGLLAGGLRALGEIFPGFESDLPEPALSRCGSRKNCNMSGRMLVYCQSAISAYQCSVRPDR